MKQAFQGQWKQTSILLLLALVLRLVLALNFPHKGGDSDIYGNFARNLLHHGIYSHDEASDQTPPPPTLIRAPGYPLFLAAVFAVAGDHNERAVRVVQALVDTLNCLLIALVVFEIASGKLDSRRRLALGALGLAAFCPFIGNYAASILTEVPTIFFLTAATLLGARGLKSPPPSSFRNFFYCGLLTGMATLFRPESGLLLASVGVVLLWRAFRRRSLQGFFRQSFLLALGLLLPLLPWTARNLITLKTFQPLAPFNAEDPGEFVPRGYWRWCKTWLWKFQDVDRFLWPVPGSPIPLDALPSSAAEDSAQRTEVTELLHRYNASLQMSEEIDARFAVLARERIHRHPFRYFVELPMLGGLALWFTPRTEILPLEGKLWPIGAAWENDPRDFSFTLFLFLVNFIYVALAIAGAWKLRRQRQWLLLLVSILLIRTLLLAYIAFPEPRYVLEAYPAVLILGAFAFGVS